MFYFNVYSLIIILLAGAVMVFQWVAMSSRAPWALRLREMAPSPDEPVAANDSPVRDRAVAGFYWLVFAFMVGQILRAVSANWLLLAILAIVAAFATWRLVRPRLQSLGATLAASADARGPVNLLAGIFAGMLTRQLLSWQGSIVAIVAIVVVAIATFAMFRPAQSGFLKNP